MIALDQLSFDPIVGIGHYPVSGAKYDQAYFNQYVAYSNTPFGVALNSLRVGLVSRYMTPSHELLDIGVGDGAFIRARAGATYGYDINPRAQDMLINDGCWRNATYMNEIPAAAFWDSLEHLECPEDVIRKVVGYCFVSIPIFRDREHILKSKHFKPAEHYWYFTKAGLIQYFWTHGFVCVEMNDMETSLGREDIGTFVFLRR